LNCKLKREFQNKRVNYHASACVSNYPLFGDLPRFDRNFTSLMSYPTKTIKESIDEVKGNLKYITENIKHHPSMETCLDMNRNEQLLAEIRDKTTYKKTYKFFQS
jgi:hypothetical protein